MGSIARILPVRLMTSLLKHWSWKERSGGYYVFVVPIEKEVDRKAAAKSVGEKTVDMIHVKDLEISVYSRRVQSAWNEKELSSCV